MNMRLVNTPPSFPGCPQHYAEVVEFSEDDDEEEMKELIENNRKITEEVKNLIQDAKSSSKERNEKLEEKQKEWDKKQKEWEEERVEWDRRIERYEEEVRKSKEYIQRLETIDTQPAPVPQNTDQVEPIASVVHVEIDQRSEPPPHPEYRAPSPPEERRLYKLVCKVGGILLFIITWPVRKINELFFS